MEELKPFEEILTPDFRSSCRGYTIETLYKLAAQHELSPAAPEDVRHQFEIARHAYIYASLYTPLCSAAQFYAILAIERALRLRLRASQLAKAYPNEPGLKGLLRIAIDEQWLRDEGFVFDFREQVMTETGIEYRPIPGERRRRPTEIVLQFLPDIRNEIAHGQPSMTLEEVGLRLAAGDDVEDLRQPDEAALRVLDRWLAWHILHDDP